MDVIEELKFLGKFTKKNIFFFFGGGGGSGWLGVGQDGYEQRIEVFVKIQKKKFFFFLGGGGGVRVDVNEFFVKNQKKNHFFFFGGGGGRVGWGGGVGLGGIRVDVNEEFKFLGKFPKKKLGGGGYLENEKMCGGRGNI